MGEGKRKGKLRQRILHTCPFCIYCGGTVAATTIDHMPPRIMFKGKQRPEGLEFASCQSCNQGTKEADLVAALIGRGYPGASSELEGEEYKQLLRAISNNIPGLLEEMHIGRGGQRLARKSIPTAIDGGLFKVDGPLVSAHMQTFAEKVGFALFFEFAKTVVPPEGGVAARWFSNVDVLRGNYPREEISRIVGRSITLRQGTREVSDQFNYAGGLSDDKSVGAFLATFRKSFAVVAFACTRTISLMVDTEHPMKIVQPSDFLSRLADVGAGNARRVEDPSRATLE
jgi:hypothetical protein